MHIAFVVEHCNLRGGHERCVAEWARRLARRHRVTVVSQSLSDLPPGIVSWVPVRTQPGPAPVAYLGFYARSGSIVRRLPEAVIHSQGPNCPRFRVSSIHTVVRAKWAILRASTEFRRELTRKQYFSWYLHYWLASRFEESLFRHPMGVLAPVSYGAAREVTAIYGTPSDAITVVPNGVDLDVFVPGTEGEAEAVLSRLGLDPTKRYALFVGGEWARKGLPFAIRVIASCPPSIQLIVAGNGPVAHYEQLTQRFGVGDRVHFIGSTWDPAGLYRAGLALLMPSLYEAFSLVSLEAAASGLPLLTSAVSGTEELVFSDENGWILPDEIPIWADRLKDLAADRALAHSMGRKSRDVVSQYTWDRAVAQFETLYGT